NGATTKPASVGQSDCRKALTSSIWAIPAPRPVGIDAPGTFLGGDATVFSRAMNFPATKPVELRLQTIEQSARPEVFAGENREGCGDGQPSWPRQRNHRDSRRQQQEAARDLAVSNELFHRQI